MPGGQQWRVGSLAYLPLPPALSLFNIHTFNGRTLSPAPLRRWNTTAVGATDVDVCLPCPRGTYSAEIGETYIQHAVIHAGTDQMYDFQSHGFIDAYPFSKQPNVHLSAHGSNTLTVTLYFEVQQYPILSGHCKRREPLLYIQSRSATVSFILLCCPSPGNVFTNAGASSEDACEWCEDGLSSLGGSQECELLLTNSRRTLVIYLIVGASTLAGIAIAYETWHKKGGDIEQFGV